MKRCDVITVHTITKDVETRVEVLERGTVWKHEASTSDSTSQTFTRVSTT